MATAPVRRVNCAETSSGSMVFELRRFWHERGVGRERYPLFFGGEQVQDVPEVSL